MSTAAGRAVSQALPLQPRRLGGCSERGTRFWLVLSLPSSLRAAPAPEQRLPRLEEGCSLSPPPTSCLAAAAGARERLFGSPLTARLFGGTAPAGAVAAVAGARERLFGGPLTTQLFGGAAPAPYTAAAA